MKWKIKIKCSAYEQVFASVIPAQDTFKDEYDFLIVNYKHIQTESAANHWSMTTTCVLSFIILKKLKKKEYLLYILILCSQIENENIFQDK